MLMNYVFTLDSFFKSVLPETQNQWWLNKPGRFTHGNVLLSYVNETMYLLGNLPFFKIHVNHFMAQGDSPFNKHLGSTHSISEKAMAPHSSTLAWKIPWTEEPGRLQSMASQRVGHDWVTELSWIRERRCPKTQRLAPGPSPTTCILR